MEIDLRQQEKRATGKPAPAPTATPASRGPAPLPMLPVTIGAAQAIAHSGWVSAREAALAALRSGPCVVAVAGPAGTGKTLLLEELGRVLAKGGFTTALHARGDLGEDEAGTRDAQAALRVVLIDEAERLDRAALARLAADNQCGLVLARTHAPADFTTDRLCAAAAGGRPVNLVRLAPLLPGETGQFVRERLTRAGHPADAIGAAGIAEIERFSGRVPRLVNMLASAALFLAASNDESQVDAEHVAEAAALRGLSAPPKQEESPSVAATSQPDEAAAILLPAPAAEPVVIPPERAEPASPAPVVVPAVEPVAMPAAAQSTFRVLPAPADRPLVLRRAAIVALCTVAGGAAAVGWFTAHETGRAAHRSGAGTTASLTRPAGSQGAALPHVAQATQHPAVAPPAAHPLASAAARPAPGPRALPPAPKAVASQSAPAPLAPPPPNSTPGPRAPSGTPSVASVPAPATGPEQAFAQAGSKPSQDVALAAVLGASGPAGDPPGAGAKPPPAKVAPVAAAAEPPAQAKPAPAPASVATPAPAPKAVASLRVKPPVPGAATPNPAQPDSVVSFVPPVPPPDAPGPRVAKAEPPPASAGPEPARAPEAARAAAEPSGGWGPLSLSDLGHYDSPPQPAPEQHAGPAPHILGTLRTRSHTPPPPEPDSQPAPQRYVGVYVTQPDGRRTFIAAP